MTPNKDCTKYGRTGVRAAFLAGMVALAGNIPPASAEEYEFSIGFDVGLEYSKLAQKTKISIAVPPVDNTDHVRSVETVTRIMLRAYF